MWRWQVWMLRGIRIGHNLFSHNLQQDVLDTYSWLLAQRST